MKTKKSLTLTFTDNEVEWMIAAFRDAQLALCGADGNPEKAKLGDFLWREAMENSLVNELNKIKKQ